MDKQIRYKWSVSVFLGATGNGYEFEHPLDFDEEDGPDTRRQEAIDIARNVSVELRIGGNEVVIYRSNETLDQHLKGWWNTKLARVGHCQGGELYDEKGNFVPEESDDDEDDELLPDVVDSDIALDAIVHIGPGWSSSSDYISDAETHYF